MEVKALDYLNGLVMFQPDVHIYQGGATLEVSDLKDVKSSQMPPECLLKSRGSKQVFPPQIVKDFEAMRNEQRSILRVGIKVMGSYGVPRTRVLETWNELEALRNRWDDFVSKLEDETILSGYYNAWFLEDAVAQWLVQMPGLRQYIEARKPTRSGIRKLFRYGFNAFSVSKSKVADLPQLDASLDQCAKDIPNVLFQEIADEASKTLKESFSGRVEVTPKILQPFRRWREKLDAFKALDTRVVALVNKIDATLAGQPKTGKIAGSNLVDLTWLVNLLVDPNKAKQFAVVGAISADDTDARRPEGSTQETQTELLRPAPTEDIQPIGAPVETHNRRRIVI